MGGAALLGIGEGGDVFLIKRSQSRVGRSDLVLHEPFEQLVHAKADFKVLFDQADLIGSDSHGGVEVTFTAVLGLEAFQGRLDFIGAGWIDHAERLLGEQHPPDDVLARRLTELGIALAAGDVVHPLVIRLDLRKLGIEDRVFDRPAIDDQGHRLSLLCWRYPSTARVPTHRRGVTEAPQLPELVGSEGEC